MTSPAFNSQDAAIERADRLVNPYETNVLDPRWNAFEGYRENVMASLEGEYDSYTDAELQVCAEEHAAAATD